MSMNEMKRGLSHVWETLAEGWHRLRDGAYGAMTRFKQSDVSHPSAGLGWGVLAAEIKDQGNQILVRLEAPGMEADGFSIDVNEDLLSISGEKHYQKSSEQGQYLVRECAYGRFERQLVLPVAVSAEGATARYQHGVLQISLNKKSASQRRRIEVSRA